MPPFVHESGLCESPHVGDGTRVWAFAHILPGAVVGADCNICDGVFIENQVVLGDRVTVKCGVQLWDGVTVENDVFIGPNATFSNDLFPRSRQHPTEYAKTRIGAHASIGANATILPGITIGQYAMVGAGAVVTRSVPPYAVVYGNPARIMDYVGAHRERTDPDAASKSLDPSGSTAVSGVHLHRLPLVEDLRGNLSVGEFERTVPFQPRRYFLVYDVPTEKVRGQHAHRECHQFLICVKGRCSVVADDGKNREEYILDQPNLGLHLPPMVWGIQYKYTPDTVLLVFASHYYDAEDYIRDYDEFLKEVHAKTP